MTGNNMELRELFIRNRDTVKSVFKWDWGMMNLCCAYLYTMRGKTADMNSLARNKKLLKERVGTFSNFRSTGRDILVTLLDMADNPESLLDSALRIYDLLKRELHTSAYLPIVAMLLAELADPCRYDEIVSRISTLYKRIRHEHPWLISGRHFALCALLAMSDQQDDILIERVEQGYNRLKSAFKLSGDEVQAVAHIMALTPGDIDAKCDRVLALIDAMKEKGKKWNGYHELPVLGIIAEDSRSAEELSAAIAENDRWLLTQKGFGGSFFSFTMINRTHRLLYAALLTREQKCDRSFSTILTEQAVIYAGMSATTMASGNRGGY